MGCAIQELLVTTHTGLRHFFGVATVRPIIEKLRLLANRSLSNPTLGIPVGRHYKSANHRNLLVAIAMDGQEKLLRRISKAGKQI